MYTYTIALTLAALSLTSALPVPDQVADLQRELAAETRMYDNSQKMYTDSQNLGKEQLSQAQARATKEESRLRRENEMETRRLKSETALQHRTSDTLDKTRKNYAAKERRLNSTIKKDEGTMHTQGDKIHGQEGTIRTQGQQLQSSQGLNRALLGQELSRLPQNKTTVREKPPAETPPKPKTTTTTPPRA